MRLFYYLALGVLILACAGLFVFKQPDGSAWLNFSGIVNPIKIKTQTIQNNISNKIQNIIPVAGAQQSKTVEVFKWQDEKGEWHYSDKQLASSNAKNIAVKATNIVSIKVEQANKLQVEEKSSKQRLSSDPLQPSSLSKISTLIDDAQNVQTLMNQRTKQLDKAIEQK